MGAGKVLRTAGRRDPAVRRSGVTGSTRWSRTLRRSRWARLFVVCFAMASTATGSVPATAARPPSLSVKVDPALEAETGGNEVHAVVQVSGPAFAGDTVTIDSAQLQAACAGGFAFETLQGGSVSAPVTGASLSVVLDNLGRATVSLSGSFCAQGSSTIDATLASSPFRTASTKLTVEIADTDNPRSLCVSHLRGRNKWRRCVRRVRGRI